MNNPLFELLAAHAASFFQLVGRTASVLIDLGIGPGDRVALQATKSVEALAVYLGCVQTGAAFLPLNTAYTEREIEYFLTDAGRRCGKLSCCVA